MTYGRSAADVTDAEIVKAMRRYLPLLDAETLAYVSSLDGANERYFWAYLCAHEAQETDRVMIRALEDAIGSLVEPEAEPSATPFSDAEDLLRPSSYFRTAGAMRIGR